jgi:carbamate kinase
VFPTVKTAVIAIGGNAILKPNEEGTAEKQRFNIDKTTAQIAKIVKMGYKVIITHGNGPQVGNILLKNDFAHGIVPPMPMDVCVAESQGQMGYMIQQSLANKLRELGLSKYPTSIITQVVVDENDEAFASPTKPVGPYYHEERAQDLAKKKGWTMMQDYARHGYRRVVPSPKPIRVVEGAIIKDLLEREDDGNIIIALGGGGVPVIQKENSLFGIEAVVDKDLASQLLATQIQAQLLCMVTDVQSVAINFGEPSQKDLDKMNVSDARRYLKEGHFPPGSMGPKILSSIRFLESGGEQVIITTSENLVSALKDGKGTRIFPG